jgi:hypothetical protein
MEIVAKSEVPNHALVSSRYETRVDLLEIVVEGFYGV